MSAAEDASPSSPPTEERDRKVEEASIVRVGDECYVWDVRLVQELRERHRVVGAMVGGVADYKQQDTVRGLPLQLLPAEEAFLRERNVIRPVHVTREYSAKRRARVAWEAPEGTDGSGVKVIPLSNPRPSDWIYEHRRGNPEEPSRGPRTDGKERRKALVYADLHRLGMHVTSGLKFGADFLAYPGDPSVYHAQFVVRVMDHDEPLDPLSLSGSARVAHAARKHLLLASVERDGNPSAVHYSTLGPDGGFQPQSGPA